MSTVENIRKIHDLFPNSIVVNMPSYNTPESVKNAKEKISLGNQIIEQAWGKENVVDTFETSERLKSEGAIVFYDGLHFTDEFDKLYRIPKIIERIWVKRITSGNF
jgi:hypothetical protein